MAGKEDNHSPPSSYPPNTYAQVGLDKVRRPVEQRTLPKHRPLPESEHRPTAAAQQLEKTSSTLKSGGRTSSSTKSVENYAQLSSLPEFKAFRLNQDESSDRRQMTQAEASGSSVPNNEPIAEKQEWMREIRVSRRTKKQSYVRSGTHDFCIRLYTGQEEEEEE